MGHLLLVKEVSPCTPPPRSSSLFSSPELTPPCWRHQLLQILRKANLIIVIPDQLCPRLDVGGCEECNPGEPQIVTVHLGKGTFFWISRFSKSGIAVLPSKTSISQQQQNPGYILRWYLQRHSGQRRSVDSCGSCSVQDFRSLWRPWCRLPHSSLEYNQW